MWASSHFPPGGIREALLEAHHVVRPERLESDGSTARHVVVGCEERPADLAKLSAEKIRLGDPEHPHGQIGLAAENIEGGVGRDHLDPDGGKSLVQRREPLAEEANERVGRGQLNGALEPFVLSADAALERGAGGLHSLRRVRRRVAGRGEDEPLGNASDEARLERFLERGQTAAHRRVIDLERARRAHQRAFPLQRQQESKIVPVHLFTAGNVCAARPRTGGLHDCVSRLGSLAR